MKKKFKTAGVVALSALLACGSVAAFAGCKKGRRSDTIYVSIFCNASDAATNRAICNQWAKDYGAKIGQEIQVDLQTNTDKEDYFKKLSDSWTTNAGATDVIYLAPRAVKTYVETGKILDLTDYLTADEKASVGDIWQNGLNYYGYKAGAKTDYTMGQSIKYDAASGKFVTDNSASETVGLYALPKDYSNFSTGYNKKFFSEDFKKAYTSTLATKERNVKGPVGEGSGEFSSQRTYSGASGKMPSSMLGVNSCIVYAKGVSGQYTNPYTNEKITVASGQPANIINVGIPTTYYPFNFFKYNTFDEALKGGDPMALMSKEFEGYTVTVPGFPDETFQMPDGTYDSAAPYDTTMGHMVYTYAEYSALLWAMMYYLNTFGWCDTTTGAFKQDLSAHTQGQGGMLVDVNSTTKQMGIIYGGEQYEGTLGSPLYLLPWLASNDADLVSADSRYCIDMQTDNAKALENPADWKSVASTATTERTRMTLSGNKETKQVQYGYNSQNFIETYAAFLALSSDWNGNPMGDTDASRANNGWSYFRAGRSIFYGAGSWDAATRNEVDRDLLDFGQMATPVAEKYALYSSIKDANYQRATYSNDPAATAQDAQRSNLDDGKSIYSTDDIYANLARRQDKWAARMDSVGYAVNALNAKKYRGTDAEWKVEGAVSLVAALTIDKTAMKTLTYGGAQFPNFVSQCKDFFNYQTAGADGAFSDMITPEGFSTTQYYNADGTVNESGAAEAKKIWDYYYGIAKEMGKAAIGGSSQTVEQFLADKKDYDGTGTIRYDAQYKDVVLGSSAYAKETSGISTAMKILKMTTFTRADRDLNIRMQYGLNAVRDSSMYTYAIDWMGEHDARQSLDSVFAYRLQQSVSSVLANKNSTVLLNPAAGIIRYNPAQSQNNYSFQTPFCYCLSNARAAQNRLTTAYNNEINDMK